MAPMQLERGGSGYRRSGLTGRGRDMAAGDDNLLCGTAGVHFLLFQEE